MRRRTPVFLASLLCLLLASSASAQATSTTHAAHPADATTIVFVRHAEAGGGDPRDPVLTAAGEARASALVKALAHADVAAVFTTQFKRTSLTGGAVAKATGAKHEVVPVRGQSIEQESEALVKRIAQEYPGRTVLVVGHSNTVPVLVSKAIGASVDPIPETEYGRMYIVTMRGSKGTLVQAAY